MRHLRRMRRGQCNVPPNEIGGPGSLGLNILNRNTPSEGPRGPTSAKIVEGKGPGKT